MRGVDKASINRTLENIQAEAENVAVTDRVGVRIEMLTADSPVPLNETLTEQTEGICKELGYSFLHMNSGAGHDAMHMAKLAPASMLFVPCKGGISHNPAEYADNEDICLAIEILAEAVKEEASA